MHGICSDADSLCLLLVGNSVASHQQAVGIDSIGSTGYQSTQVLALLNFQIVHLIGQDNTDLVNLIGKGLIQSTDHKDIPLLQLIQVGKKLGTWAVLCVRREHSGYSAAYRQGAPSI